MKVNNIQTYGLNCQNRGNGSNSMNQNKNNPSFGGNIAINFWDAIARGGFAASFTVQDMTGTNFPRTYQALQRNKEITGKNNYKAAAEVAVREFVTGPSMCLIPMLVLAGAKKMHGSANDVPLNNIEVFSDITKDVLKNNELTRTDHGNITHLAEEYAQKIKGQSYQKMFALALGEDVSKEASKEAKDLAKMLEDYDVAKKRGFFKQLLNKPLTSKGKNGKEIKAKDQIFADIITKFTDTKKAKVDDYSNLLTVTFKKADGTEVVNNIQTLVKDFSNFGNDVSKTIVNTVGKSGSLSATSIDHSSFMDYFKSSRVGSKFATNVIMAVATALFMKYIPKLYTIYKTNPETDAFRGPEGEVVRANK